MHVTWNLTVCPQHFRVCPREMFKQFGQKVPLCVHTGSEGGGGRDRGDSDLSVSRPGGLWHDPGHREGQLRQSAAGPTQEERTDLRHEGGEERAGPWWWGNSLCCHADETSSVLSWCVSVFAAPHRSEKMQDVLL